MRINVDRVRVARWAYETGPRCRIPVWLKVVKNVPPVEVAPLAHPIYTFWLMCANDLDFWVRTGITREMVGEFAAGRINPTTAEIGRLLRAALGMGKVGEEHAKVFGGVLGAALLAQAEYTQAVAEMVWTLTVREVALELAGVVETGAGVATVDYTVTLGEWMVGVFQYALRCVGVGVENGPLRNVTFPAVWGVTAYRAAQRDAGQYARFAKLMEPAVLEVLLLEETYTPEELAQYYMRLPARGLGLGVDVADVVKAGTGGLVMDAQGKVVRRGPGRPPGAKNKRKFGVGGFGKDTPVDFT